VIIGRLTEHLDAFEGSASSALVFTSPAGRPLRHEPDFNDIHAADAAATGTPAGARSPRRAPAKA
jgi:hypothetical protein